MIFAGIIAMIAIGCLVAYAVVMTIRWLRTKIKEKLANKNISKVVAADLGRLVDECDNKMSMNELDSFIDEGYTHVMASVDDSGQVSDVEIIKNINHSIDDEVEQLINRTGEGMIVVEG